MIKGKTLAIGVAAVVALSGALVVGTPEPVSAATIIVAAGAVGIANDGQCSLIEAIINANTDARVFSADGECLAGSGADTIVLSPGAVYTLTSAYLETLNGLPVITTQSPLRATGPPSSGIPERPSSVSSRSPAR